MHYFDNINYETHETLLYDVFNSELFAKIFDAQSHIGSFIRSHADVTTVVQSTLLQ